MYFRYNNSDLFDSVVCFKERNKIINMKTKKVIVNDAVVNAVDTGEKDYFGNQIFVGSTIVDFKMNHIQPKVWEVYQREDGLFLCKGETDKKEMKYIGLSQLLNDPRIALAILKNEPLKTTKANTNKTNNENNSREKKSDTAPNSSDNIKR